MGRTHPARGRASGTLPAQLFRWRRRSLAPPAHDEKVQAAGRGTRRPYSVRSELDRPVCRLGWRWWRLRSAYGRSLWGWSGRRRGGCFRSFGWWFRRWARVRVLALLLVWHMANARPRRAMDPPLLWPFSDLLRRNCDRRSFHMLQPHISRHRRRLGGLEQARCNAKRQQQSADHKETQPSLRPANPEVHADLRAQLAEFSPMRLREGRRGRLDGPSRSGPRQGDHQPRSGSQLAPPQAVLGDQQDDPDAPQVTASPRNSAISAN